VAEVLPEVGTSLRFSVRDHEVSQVVYSAWHGRRSYRLGGEDVGSRFEEVNNGVSTLTSLVPGSSMLTTAGDLARIYAMIGRGGVTDSGRTALSASTLEKYVRRAVAGFDRSSRNRVVLGRGFVRGRRGPHVYGWWGTGQCAGHPGGFNTAAFFDGRTGLAVAIVTNGNRGFGDLLMRFAPLGSAIRRQFGRL
jgi:CubicO group peptidase (beta-lactamase class C family)